MLLHDFRQRHPHVTVQLLEDKSIRLLPRLLSGRLDLAFVRPPELHDNRIEFLMLFHETAVVAVPARHKLASSKRLSLGMIADQPLIVADRRARPHSHDLTVKLFDRAGLRPTIAQIAEEKLVNLVAAKLGLAIVPRWTSRMAVSGVRYVPLMLPKTKTIESAASCGCLGAQLTRRDARRIAGDFAEAIVPLCGGCLMVAGFGVISACSSSQ
jgi:DNA-binding transcriptional LysR family regulator